MNPFSGIITPGLKKIFTDGMNALLADDGATVPCEITYGGTKWETCPNCKINPINKKSSGIYNGIGPISFSSGPCPYCKGEGRKEITSTEEIYLMVIWDHKKWFPLSYPLLTPEGYIQTVSNITSMPKLKRAKEIVINTNIVPYVRNRYVREGEPNPCGCCVGDEAFIVTMWKKAG